MMQLRSSEAPHQVRRQTRNDGRCSTSGRETLSRVSMRSTCAPVSLCTTQGVDIYTGAPAKGHRSQTRSGRGGLGGRDGIAAARYWGGASFRPRGEGSQRSSAPMPPVMNAGVEHSIRGRHYALTNGPGTIGSPSATIGLSEWIFRLLVLFLGARRSDFAVFEPASVSAASVCRDLFVRAEFLFSAFSGVASIATTASFSVSSTATAFRGPFSASRKSRQSRGRILRPLLFGCCLK
jgi:hypothetical protein